MVLPSAAADLLVVLPADIVDSTGPAGKQAVAPSCMTLSHGMQLPTHLVKLATGPDDSTASMEGQY
jgi:hypothetical protein